MEREIGDIDTVNNRTAYIHPSTRCGIGRDTENLWNIGMLHHNCCRTSCSSQLTALSPPSQWSHLRIVHKPRRAYLQAFLISWFRCTSLDLFRATHNPGNRSYNSYRNLPNLPIVYIAISSGQSAQIQHTTTTLLQLFFSFPSFFRFPSPRIYSVLVHLISARALFSPIIF